MAPRRLPVVLGLLLACASAGASTDPPAPPDRLAGQKDIEEVLQDTAGMPGPVEADGEVVDMVEHAFENASAPSGPEAEGWFSGRLLSYYEGGKTYYLIAFLMVGQNLPVPPDKFGQDPMFKLSWLYDEKARPARFDFTTEKEQRSLQEQLLYQSKDYSAPTLGGTEIHFEKADKKGPKVCDLRRSGKRMLLRITNGRPQGDEHPAFAVLYEAAPLR
jgi:hypothetical protein